MYLLKFHLVPTVTLLLTLATITVSSLQTEIRRRRELHRPNKFIHVQNSCEPGSLQVTVGTSEPFTGAVYARGYPSSSCLVHGQGATSTNLTLQAQSCGLKVTESESGSHNIYEVQVYIQFDRWVQQVIDEQIHVRCLLKQPLSHLHLATQKLKKDIGKFVSKLEVKTTKSPAEVIKNQYQNISGVIQPKFVFKDHDNSVIIQGPNSKEDKPKSSTLLSDEANSTVSVLSGNFIFGPVNTSKSNSVSPTSKNVMVSKKEGNSAGDVVSEIKISSSPNSEETEAMVASTLLTVSSRVRERLRNKEKTTSKLYKLDQYQSSSSTDKPSQGTLPEKEILKRVLNTKDSGSKDVSFSAKRKADDDGARKKSSGNKGKILLADVLPSEVEQNENDGLDEWKPVAGLMDPDIWRNDTPGGSEEEPVSVWMDIVKGEDYKGEKASGGLLVGEEATLVVSARARSGLSTLVTECSAHDGSGGGQQDLTDARGCAVDPSILPQLEVVTEVGSDVSISHASFRAFKFPDRGSLHLRCTVLICLGDCPKSNCDVIVAPRKPGSPRRGRKLEEVLGVGEFEATDILTREAIGVKQPRGGLTLSVGLNLEEPQISTPTSDSPPQEANSISAESSRAINSRFTASSSPNKLFAVVVDRIEVYNSVEVRAPGIETQPRDLVKQHRWQEDEDDVVDRQDAMGTDMFCIAPQKLVVAFGILLSVLLAAMLFALYTCARHRLLNTARSSQQRRLMCQFERSSTPSPLSSPHAPPSPHAKASPCHPPNIIAPGVEANCPRHLKDDCESLELWSRVCCV